MKKFLLLIFSLIPLVTIAQIPSEFPTDKDGRIYYYEKVQIDTISKNQLYVNSKLVFLNAFKPSNYLIQMDNQKEGVIIGTGFNDINFIFHDVNIKQQMWFTIKIQYQDGSYDFNIYDIYCRSYPKNNRIAEPSFEKFSPYSNAMNKNIQGIIHILKTTMIKGILREDNPHESKLI